jgi:hypothetical protein
MTDCELTNLRAENKLLAAELEKHREAIRRLADQDATLSVCNGNVIVTMDATLTDEEREAIGEAIRLGGQWGWSETLRGLLKRLG